ncbi:MAG: dihydropteroate synthase [Thermodesulfobacteriota bacterium]|nr:dihydropteroate synthase [Thermodesulfobacteriota bacterium]
MKSFTLQWDRFKLELGEKTSVMGILNTTPDSFSDGGKYLSFDAAVSHGLELVKQGADILDIGGESSRPFAEPVSAKMEMERVVPVIEKLAKTIDIPISIDTTKASVAEAALNAGAAIINDISALEKDPAMAGLAAKREVPVILMHMKGTPQTMQIDPAYKDIMQEIRDYLADRTTFAVKAGIKKENIILDPGLGFGKSVEDNLMLIKHLGTIHALGLPLLMGPSRKSFIQKILSKLTDKTIDANSKRAEQGTLAAIAVSIINNAQIVRVHDVASVKPMVKIINAIQNV